ncbi:MAG: Asp23/Gls24 family envelope stress response protein [Chloroflexi bacterium]|nr:Asp23/Gls24 family envelope stress response protein [Chloroflexota bacterium]
MMNEHPAGSWSGEFPAGRVTVTPRAIASIVAGAALQCEGVASLANPPEGRAPLLASEARRGVEVHLHQNQVIVDVYLLVRAGVPIADVAHTVQEQVRAALELALDARDPQVNVRVQGIRGRY